MTYDVQIGNTILRGISYANLVVLPIEPDTLVRRDKGEWIHATECIELTHIIAQRPALLPNNNSPILQSTIDEDSTDEFEDEIEEDVNDEDVEENDVDENNGFEEEERIFIPTAEYFKCKQKRKAAIIGVCTLGLAGLSLMGVGNTWRSNIFAGTSLSAHAGMAFVLKCISFFLLAVLTAIPYFIYSVFALIYYSIRLNSLKR